MAGIDEFLEEAEMEEAAIEAGLAADYNRIVSEQGKEAADAWYQEQQAELEELAARRNEAQEALQQGQGSAAEPPAPEENAASAAPEGEAEGPTAWEKVKDYFREGRKNAIERGFGGFSNGSQKEDEEDGQQQGEGQGFLSSLENAFGNYMGNYVSSRQGGVDPSGMSASDRRMAELQEQGAQQQYKAAQAASQIASRDYRDEADKNAAAQAAQENQQNVANRGNASAGAAALARKTATSDYNTHMQRSDTQREKAAQLMGNANAAQQYAERRRQEAKKRDYLSGLTQQRNGQVAYATQGGANEATGDLGQKEQAPQQATEPVPRTGGLREEPVSTRAEEPVSTRAEEPVPTQAEEPAAAGALPSNYQPQNVINYLLNSPIRRKDGVAYNWDTPGYELVKKEMDAIVPEVVRYYIANFDNAADEQDLLTTMSDEGSYRGEKGSARDRFMDWLFEEQGGRDENNWATPEGLVAESSFEASDDTGFTGVSHIADAVNDRY